MRFYNRRIFKKFLNAEGLCVLILMFVLAFTVNMAYAQAQGAGYALDFDGVDNIVDCGNLSVFNGVSRYTIEAWAKFDVFQNYDTIFAKRVSDSDRAAMLQCYYSSGQVAVAVSNGTDKGYGYTSVSLSTNKWYHFAVVYDGTQTGNANRLKLYVNGSPMTLTFEYFGNPSDVPSTTPTTASRFTLGAEYNGTTPITPASSIYVPFEGTIDEVRIWSIARTAEQIRADMCKTLTGSESNLDTYYKMSDGSGSTLTDDSINSHNGTLVNMADTDWITSGAALGDASTYDYSSPSSLNLASSYGDDVTVDTISGSPDGVQIFRVDSAPNVTTPPGNLVQLSEVHYFGVFVTGGTSPTYTLTYDYDGHPGITDESTLDLATRANNAATSWTEANATLDQGANTLTLTGQSGTEYILGSESGDNSLPVELSSFTATASDERVTLRWITQTEVNNVGFGIYRSEEKDGNYVKIAFVSGAGNTAMPTDYQFVDKKTEAGKTYFYYLEDIDIAGERSKSDIIKVIVPPAKPVQPIPKVFRLLQNYPNPFNPETWIPFDLAADATVTIRIYDVKGQLVRQLELSKQKAGSYLNKDKAAYWNGKDQLGQSVSSGLYFYVLKAGSFVATRRMVILK